MKRKILIVDDDPNQHRINAFLFQKRGFEVVSAFTGEEGLQQLLQEKPDLVLLDFMMPGISGETFLKILWNDPLYSEVKTTPVVMLTAAGHERVYVEDLLKKGLAAYLQKPFGEHELFNVVENVLVNYPEMVSHKQDLQHLRESLDFLSNILQNFPGVVFTTTLDGEISFFSEGSTSFLQTPTSSILRKPIFDLFEVDYAKLVGILRRLRSGEGPISLETEMRASGRRTVPVELSLAVFRDAHGEVSGILGLAKDLSLVKKLERERIEKERIAAIVQAMATVNHEINNPLTPILGNLDLILEEADQLPQPVVAKIRNIKENALRIAENVQKMRSISQPVFKPYYDGEYIIDLEKSR